MNNNINKILDKYWNAETSLDEEATLKAYFTSADVSDEHKEYVPLFSTISQCQLQESSLDINKVLSVVDDIDSLIAKFKNAETTLEEETILKSYFSGDVPTEHQELKPLFDYYNLASQMSTDMSFDIESISDNTDIDALLSKYLKAETTIEDEKVLYTYFRSESVEDKHLEYKPLFDYFDVAAGMTTNIDITSLFNETINIDSLLNKYWEAETTLGEEKKLYDYFNSDDVAERHNESKDLFLYYANQKNIVTDIDLNQLFEEENTSTGSAKTDNTRQPKANQAKVFNLRRMASAVAAVFILGFAAISVMNQSAETETQYRGKYVQLDEEADAKEAYEITKQAFALLSKKMNKGSKTVKTSMKKAENASIFK